MRRIRLAVLALATVLVAGTVGYMILGFGLLEALYQTVTTVTTVGFREVHPLTAAGQVFTIVLILIGVGTALYTFGVLLEALLEGHLRQHIEGRRMTSEISKMTDHVVICGWGRVGRACAEYLRTTGHAIVVVDRDPARLEGIEYAFVLGDISDDRVLVAAGITHAHALIAALNTDADNVYVTLSSRALSPELVIIARARNEESKSKLVRAGADRVVNPQLLGGRRMGTFALQPHVAEFLEMVMHDENLDYRIEEIKVRPGARLAGKELREAGLETAAGVQLLAIRPAPARPFLANPGPSTRLEPGAILIVVGTSSQLEALHKLNSTT